MVRYVSGRTNEAAVQAARDVARLENAPVVSCAQVRAAEMRVEQALAEYGRYPGIGQDVAALIDEARAEVQS
jgi:hypothetical protein